MKYEEVLRRISEIPVLQTEIRKMSESCVLNLTAENWEQVLKNDIAYQNFVRGKVPFSDKRKKTHIEMQYFKGYDVNYTVLVVGSFVLQKNDENVHLICRECPPLEKIYHAVMGQESTDHVPHKFNFLPCDIAFCSQCDRIQKMGQSKEINMKNQWCVLTNKIFNGETLKNLLEVNVQKDFGKSSFLAVVALRIKGRYFYGDDFKQSKLFGDVSDMILFKEQALLFNKDEELNIDFPDADELHSQSLLEGVPSTSFAEPPILKPIDAIPRGVKRSLEEEEENDFTSWDIKWKTGY